MIDPTTPAMPDAERVAGWSATALAEGRYELGYALARLAVQASKMEESARPLLVPVPGAAQAGHRPALSTSTPWLAPNGQATVYRPGGFEQRAPVDDPATATPVLDSIGRDVAPARCDRKVIRDGVADVCHAVVYWVADGEYYRHVHTELDTDHVPLVGLREA